MIYAIDAILKPTDPAILVASLIAAIKLKDKMLADVYRRELSDRYGITIRFSYLKKLGK